ncbi:uncharacterized protein [Magallana gigas]|uniref:uncharacterized protein isoform X1 n=1 Tax=Magallana gigas TaxID=29159 RepID=UPI00333FFF84
MAERFKTSQDLWHNQAVYEAQKHRRLRYQHGRGPSNIFILDTSSSIGDEGVQRMKDAFTSIIDEYSKHPDIDENVAVIVCGRQTKFLRYFSNQYEDTKRCLDDVDFGGPSPLTAAFILSTGGLMDGASSICMMGNLHFHQRFILFSDGRPTDFTISSPDDSLVLETDEAKDHLLQMTVNLGRIHPIFCIPVGRNPDMTLLEFISGQSKGGKIIHSDEARQLGKCSYNLKAASVLLQTMKNDCHDREHIVTSLALLFPYTEYTERDQDDIIEMCSRKTLFCSNHNIKIEVNVEMEMFKETNPRMPTLGSRVRRGRDWQWGNQDNMGPGTVIGHYKEDGWLHVEWDTGSVSNYRYGSSQSELNKYDVKVCIEPRILGNEIIATGCLVTRGTDWEWDDQDGGAGNIGSVISVQGTGFVYVRWRHGFISQYRFGWHGKFDLQICDPFSKEAIEYFKDQVRNASLNYPNGDQASFNEGYALGLPSSRPAISEKAKSVDTSTKPILHVVKGKYFKNSEVVDKLPPEHQKGRPKISLSMNQWFWKDDKGKWNPYSIEMNERINECYKRDPKSTVVVTIQDQCYRVVMSKSLHINLSTKDVSEVKLVNNGGSF